MTSKFEEMDPYLWSEVKDAVDFAKSKDSMGQNLTPKELNKFKFIAQIRNEYSNPCLKKDFDPLFELCNELFANAQPPLPSVDWKIS